MKSDSSGKADFDEHAAEYDSILESSLGRFSASCGKSFFDKHKVSCIKRWVPGMVPGTRLLDFGCGTGGITAMLAAQLPDCKIKGYDISRKSLDLASVRSPQLTNLKWISDLQKGEVFDVILLSNVLHHVCPAEREKLLCGLVSHLAHSGRLVVFEHNRFSPLTRWIVARCPFDNNVVLVAPSELRIMASKIGRVHMALRYVLYLPWDGITARFAELILGWAPLGAQYLAVLTRN
jgi:2-polyprenyl-3-methyl-5-hydroxy-6-metoxy-1,4-benzoquinol methylase